MLTAYLRRKKWESRLLVATLSEALSGGESEKNATRLKPSLMLARLGVK